MNASITESVGSAASIKVERTFKRFTLSQRWEHMFLILSVAGLLITGLPQKFQNTSWSQWILSTPEKLNRIQQTHHIFALFLIAGVLYHIFRSVLLMSRRRLSADIFPTWQDFLDFWQMAKYLLFLTRKKPAFSKYSFEQKFTYWFVFFGIAILIASGLVLWFPLDVTRFLPGGIVPAAFLAHSNEAIIIAVFILVWHFYHVHIQRLNLSIFSGRLSEEEMREFHRIDYERLTGEEASQMETHGGKH